MEKNAVQRQMMTSQLAVLLETGYPLVQGLAELAGPEADHETRQALTALSREIENGTPMAEALRICGDGLPAGMRVLFQGRLRGADQAVVKGLIRPQIEQLHLREAVQRELKHAVAISIVTMILTLGYLAFGVSAWGTWFGADPSPTWPVHLSQFLLTFCAGAGALLLLCLLALASFLSTGKGPGQSLALRLPLVGRLLRVSALADLSRDLALCLTAGVRLPDALELAAQSQSVERYRTSLLAFAQATLRGRAPGAPAPELAILSPSFEKLYRHAERENALTEVMAQLASLYAHESSALALYTRAWGGNILLIGVAFLAGMAIIAGYLPYLFQTTAFSLT
jgi:type II secretory pathway component PulF